MKGVSRRSLLRDALRLGAASGMVGVGALLWRRGDRCLAGRLLGRPCRGCPERTRCDLPAALRLRARARSVAEGDGGGAASAGESRKGLGEEARHGR